MELTKELCDIYEKLLREELQPAFGCTEPIAVAYCAARAREILGRLPESVLVEASGNVIKNVKSVIVPNTGGRKGLPAAAAAGIIAGRASRKLEVIADVSDRQREEIGDFLKRTRIEVRPLEGGDKLDVRIEVKAGGESALVRLARTHANIVREEKDGQVLLDRESEENGEPPAGAGEIGRDGKGVLTVENIVRFAQKADLSKVQDVLDRQISYNYAIAQEGISHDWGANVGSVLLKTWGDDVRTRAKAMAAAGSDARMSGCELPVVINSGSGNQGITVSVPVIVYAQELGVPREELYRALIVSNLIAIHIKSGIGPLSAFCGAVSAGCAAGCGIAWLMGGRMEEIAHTLVNSIAIVSGIICDGAKPSCAGKIASSVDAGILGYAMYREGQQFYAEEGIVSKGVENTIRNICRLGAKGMCGTDDEIIRIMTHCD
ncbi:MAG: hypothetical protein DBX58_06550 [Clostridiales bacterium]|nr:MAG: hypothetical protein DBX58_06550 [Clostridiales bacterium]